MKTIQTDNITSKRMRAIKSSGTKIEIKLAKALWHKGFRYRKNDKTVFGKPDLVFRKIKLAIFVDSEFWHGKNWDVRKFDFKSNIDYWNKKIERNIQRDQEVNEKLNKEGWVVIRLWGEEIENNLSGCIDKIETIIIKSKTKC